MPISRDFRGLTFRADGSILIEGRTKPDDDVPEHCILELHVMLVSRPDYAHLAHTSLEGRQLTAGDWEMTIPDVAAPFNRSGQEVVVIGFAKYQVGEGTEDGIWGGETVIG